MYKLSHTLARKFKPASQAIIYANLKALFHQLGSFDLFMQYTGPLSSFDADKLMPYYEGWLPSRISMKELSWKPLGPIGNYYLNYNLYLNAIDPDKSRHICITDKCNTCKRIKPPRPPCYFVPALWDMCLELLQNDCIVESTATPTGQYFGTPKPNSDKIRAIFNGVYCNQSDPHVPKKFSLPNFESLKPVLRKRTNVFFHHTDVCNFFWSFVLPPELHNKFVFEVLDPSCDIKRFSLNRTPFGWDFIPYIANGVMCDILSAHKHDDYTHFSYYDDHIGFSESQEICNARTADIRDDFTSRGLIIHTPGTKKSSEFASVSMEFVGKAIKSGVHPTIGNTPTTQNACTFAAIVGTAFKCSVRQVQSIIGTLLWGQIHNNLGKPYLYGMHRLAAISHNDHFWILRNTRANCIRALIAGSRPWNACDIILQMPVSYSIVAFCDASINDLAAGVCFNCNGELLYMRWHIPKRYSNSQQTCELYAYVHAFRWMARRFA